VQHIVPLKLTRNDNVSTLQSYNQGYPYVKIIMHVDDQGLLYPQTLIQYKCEMSIQSNFYHSYMLSSGSDPLKRTILGVLKDLLHHLSTEKDRASAMHL